VRISTSSDRPTPPDGLACSHHECTTDSTQHPRLLSRRPPARTRPCATHEGRSVRLPRATARCASRPWSVDSLSGSGRAGLPTDTRASRHRRPAGDPTSSAETRRPVRTVGPSDWRRPLGVGTRHGEPEPGGEHPAGGRTAGLVRRVRRPGRGPRRQLPWRAEQQARTLLPRRRRLPAPGGAAHRDRPPGLRPVGSGAGTADRRLAGGRRAGHGRTTPRRGPAVGTVRRGALRVRPGPRATGPGGPDRRGGCRPTTGPPVALATGALGAPLVPAASRPGLDSGVAPADGPGRAVAAADVLLPTDAAGAARSCPPRPAGGARDAGRDLRGGAPAGVAGRGVRPCAAAAAVGCPRRGRAATGPALARPRRLAGPAARRASPGCGDAHRGPEGLPGTGHLLGFTHAPEILADLTAP
jgi:hypothetical protein